MNTPIPQYTKGTVEYLRMIGRRGGSKRSPGKVLATTKNLERAREVGAIKRQFRTYEGVGRIMNKLTLAEREQLLALQTAPNWGTIGSRKQLDQMCSLILKLRGLKK